MMGLDLLVCPSWQQIDAWLYKGSTLCWGSYSEMKKGTLANGQPVLRRSLVDRQLLVLYLHGGMHGMIDWIRYVEGSQVQFRT